MTRVSAQQLLLIFRKYEKDPYLFDNQMKVTSPAATNGLRLKVAVNRGILICPASEFLSACLKFSGNYVG
jgi:hypothetical protein